MGNRVFAAVLAIVVGIALAPVGAAQEQKKLSKGDIKRLTQEADKFVAENNPTEARARYKAIVESDPSNVAVALKLGKTAEDLKDWEGAALAYTIASSNAKGPEQAEALGGLALTNVRRGRFTEAIESAKKAIELNATIPTAHVALAYSLVRTMAADALPAAQKAVQVAATNALAHAALGEALLRAGTFDQAEASFKKALELDPNSADAHAGMAQVYFKKGDYDNTIASADKAVALDKTIRTIYAARGRAHYAKGNDSAAYTDLGMALTVDANDVESQLTFARIQKKQNNPTLAAAAYRKVLGLDPKRSEAVVELAEIVAPKGDAEAKDLLQKALAIKTDWAEGHRLLGAIYDKEKNLDEALKSYGRAVELDPKLTETHAAIGKMKKDRKDNAAALASYEKALALAPDNAEYMTEVAALLYEAKQMDRALPLAQKATASEGYKNPVGHVVLGYILLDRKDYLSAFAAFERGAELAPKWSAPHHGAAWAIFASFKKGCPCGPDDQARLQKMKEHVDALAGLGQSDPKLDERLAILMKGEKVK
jgi:tetratricopeptide (TPR) repeat protein